MIGDPQVKPYSFATIIPNVLGGSCRHVLEGRFQSGIFIYIYIIKSLPNNLLIKPW